jgi:hypothetical protein
MLLSLTTAFHPEPLTACCAVRLRVAPKLSTCRRLPLIRRHSNFEIKIHSCPLLFDSDSALTSALKTHTVAHPYRLPSSPSI